jgi:hypothetical protein
VSRLYRLSRKSRGLAVWVPGWIVRELRLSAGELVDLIPLRDGTIIVRRRGGHDEPRAG